MAAIICKPIGDCFGFLCNAPCKICSAGCRSLCTNPLSAFVLITFATQVPIAAVALMEVGGVLKDCQGSRWLLGMLLVAIAHMATSVYLAHRVTNRTDEALRDRHSSWERISYLLCRDPFVAFYILVCIFFVIWLCMGSNWAVQGGMDRPTSDCGNEVEDRVTIALGLGWFFLFAGPTVLSCNLCCVCCDNTDYVGDDEEFAAMAAAEKAKKKQKYSKNNTNIDSNKADIENQNQSTQPQRVPESKAKADKPPRTYSVDGVLIAEEGDNISAEVLQAEAMVAENVLPPPIPPPKENVTVDAVKAKSAEDTVKSPTKKAWWFGKKKGGDGDPQQPPERKATLY